MKNQDIEIASRAETETDENEEKLTSKQEISDDEEKSENSEEEQLRFKNIAEKALVNQKAMNLVDKLKMGFGNRIVEQHVIRELDEEEK